MQSLSSEFSSYMRSYARVSLDLLGRWPTFVPEEAQTEEGLNDLKTYEPWPPLPPEKEIEEGKQEARWDAMRAKQAKMQEQIDHLGGLLRHEVDERTKANNEMMRRGVQLQALKKENGMLADSLQKQLHQLESTRAMTLKLEADLREGEQRVAAAEARLAKERKARHMWQLRCEKVQKQLEPLVEHTGVLTDCLKQTEERLVQTERGAAESKHQMEAMAEEQCKLVSRAEHMRDSMDHVKEEWAEAGLHLTLMADRRDELVGEISRRKEEGAERDRELRGLQDSLQKMTQTAQEERRLRAVAEAQRGAAQETATAAAAEVARWRGESDRLSAELQTQKEHAARMIAQDAVREAEQDRLFDTVSELLGRVQYLKDLSPADLGMGPKEAADHRDEAVRHLRALRDAHSTMSAAPSLVMAPGSIAMGAAMLSKAATTTDWHRRCSSRAHATPRLSPRTSVEAQPALHAPRPSCCCDSSELQLASCDVSPRTAPR